MSSKKESYSRQVTIHGNLLLPFGSTKKWQLDRIKLQYASSTGIHFSSDVPFVHINKRSKRALYFNQAPDIFNKPKLFKSITGDDDRIRKTVLQRISKSIQEFMDGATKYEHLFLKHYFELFQSRTYPIRAEHRSGVIEHIPAWQCGLLPIPQVQIYCEDPLNKKWPPEPDNNFRVDFAFWTGEKLVAVEIDGYEPSGYERDVRRDRMLRRAGVDLIHILNRELETHGIEALRSLLPNEITNREWSLTDDQRNKLDYKLYTYETDFDEDEIPF